MVTRKTTKKLKSLVNKKEIAPSIIKSSEKKTFNLKNFKNPKIFVPLTIIALTLFVFLFKGLFVAALVNGEPIGRLSVIKDLEKRDGKQILSQLVAQTLILQEAKKDKNIDVTEQELNDAVKKIEDNISKQGQNLDQVLQSQGMSRNDFLTQVKIQKIVGKRFAKDIKVTSQEVDEYIEKNKDRIPKDMKEEEVKTSVKQQLEQQKLAGKFQPWLDSLQKNAKINYFVNY